MTLDVAAFAPAATSRDFYVRAGNEADADIVRHVFDERAYDLRQYPGGAWNAVLLADRYARIRKAGKLPLIIDAGAMIGAAAVFFALLYPDGVIVAIEPERTNFAMLERNCRDLNVRALCGALAATEAPLFLRDPGKGHFGFGTGTSGVYPVDAFTVAGILSEYDADFYEPFICKINIEGGEAELFGGDVGWLDAFAAIAIELHDWMLPGRAVSRHFLRAIAARDFDFTAYGLQTFCFNNAVLHVDEAPRAELGELVRRPEFALGAIDRAMVTGLGDGRCETSRPLVLPAGSRLEIEGWAADPAARRCGAGLVAHAGETRLDLSAGYGDFRSDVSEALGGDSAFDRSGFGATIEASALPAGRHDLELGVIAANGTDFYALSERLDVIVAAAPPGAEALTAP